jgi:predicted lipoprotein
MIQYILGAIGAFVFLSTSALASDSAPRSLHTEKLVSAIFQPAHPRFAESKNLWALEAEGLCNRPSASSIYKFQTSFTDLVTEFPSIDFFHLGSLLENHLQHRYFYWPDTRRVGERQLRGLLTDPEMLRLDADGLAKKSVALQGFSAMERLPFSSQYLPIEALRSVMWRKLLYEILPQWPIS